MTRPHQVLNALFNSKPLSVDDFVEQIEDGSKKAIASGVNHCAKMRWIRTTGERLSHNRALYEITYYGRQKLKELQIEEANKHSKD